MQPPASNEHAKRILDAPRLGIETVSGLGFRVKGMVFPNGDFRSLGYLTGVFFVRESYYLGDYIGVSLFS